MVVIQRQSHQAAFEEKKVQCASPVWLKHSTASAEVRHWSGDAWELPAHLQGQSPQSEFTSFPFFSPFLVTYRMIEKSYT